MEGLYFSSADGGIEHSVDQLSFDRSLMYNLLFEDAPLVIPDIFFFNCKFLRAHMAGERRLFHRALHAGLIRPAFRQAGTESFEQSLDVLGEQQIHGIEQSGFNARTFARKLDASFATGEKSTIKTWPEEIGVAFGNVLREVLGRAEDFAVSGQQVQNWRRALSWRTDCVDRAEQLTKERGGSGIRRAELFNAVAWQEGLLPRGQTMDRPYQLIEAARASADRDRLEAIRMFVDVVNLAYQRSQADKFMTWHNIPDRLSRYANFVLPFSNPEHEPAAAGHDTLVTVPIPSSLYGLDSGQLLAVRGSDEAQEYFDARREWAADSSNGDRARELDKTARTYAKGLLKAVRASKSEAASAVLSVRILREGVVPIAATTLSDIGLDVIHASPYYKLVTAGVGVAVFTFNLINSEFRPPSSTVFKIQHHGPRGELNTSPSGLIRG